MITQIEIQHMASAAESLKLLLDKTNPNRLKQGDEITRYNCGEAWMLRADLLDGIRNRQGHQDSKLRYLIAQHPLSFTDSPTQSIDVENYDRSGRPVIITNDLAVQVVELAAKIAQHNQALLHTVQEYGHRLRDAEQVSERNRELTRLLEDAYRREDHFGKEANLAYTRLQTLLSIRGVKKLAARAGLLARWFKQDNVGGTKP